MDCPKCRKAMLEVGRYEGVGTATVVQDVVWYFRCPSCNVTYSKPSGFREDRAYLVER